MPNFTVVTGFELGTYIMKYNPKYMSRLKYKFIEMSKHSVNNICDVSLFFRICNVDIISLRIRCIKWAKQEENSLYCFYFNPAWKMLEVILAQFRILWEELFGAKMHLFMSSLLICAVYRELMQHVAKFIWIIKSGLCSIA